MMKKVVVDGFDYYVDTEDFVIKLYETETLENIADILPVYMRGRNDYYKVNDRRIQAEALKQLCEDDKITDILALKIKDEYLNVYDSILEELYEHINHLLPSVYDFTNRYVEDRMIARRIVSKVKKLQNKNEEE